jgi:hypothetical protein
MFVLKMKLYAEETCLFPKDFLNVWIGLFKPNKSRRTWEVLLITFTATRKFTTLQLSKIDSFIQISMTLIIIILTYPILK